MDHLCQGPAIEIGPTLWRFEYAFGPGIEDEEGNAIAVERTREMCRRGGRWRVKQWREIVAENLGIGFTTTFVFDTHLGG